MSLYADLQVGAGAFTLTASVTVAAGEVVAVVGPNGAGKTTLLRAVAGLAPLRDGSVQLDGRVLEDARSGHRAPANDRGLGVVFQEALLFPHLSVLENVAFGPRAAGWSRGEARRRARAELERVGLAERADLRPAQLSGGQAQRVALARALATDPGALLLDEPLSALDVATRHAVRRELYRHLHAFAGPTLLVTHDPVEAATLADRLVVLEDGQVTQTGTVADVTRRPRSTWVARLAGVNLYRGVAGPGGAITLAGGSRLIAASAAVGEVWATLAPSAVALYRTRPEGTPRNVWPVQVVALEPAGDRLRVQLRGELELVAEITPAAAAALEVGAGGQLWAAAKATEVTVYPA